GFYLVFRPSLAAARDRRALSSPALVGQEANYRFSLRERVRLGALSCGGSRGYSREVPSCANAKSSSKFSKEATHRSGRRSSTRPVKRIRSCAGGWKGYLPITSARRASY